MLQLNTVALIGPNPATWVAIYPSGDSPGRSLPVMLILEFSEKLAIPFSNPVHGHVTELEGGTHLGHKTTNPFREWPKFRTDTGT